MLRIVKCVVIVLVLLWGVRLGVAQEKRVPDAWLGVWKLNPVKSTFDERAGLTILGQTLTLSATDTELKLVGDTVLPDGQHLTEISTVQLNGKETVVMTDVVASFKRVDDQAFDIIINASTALGKGTGINHFAFSTDGKTLTETKTQTLRAAISGAAAATKAPIIRTSTAVLVFEKQVPEK